MRKNKFNSTSIALFLLITTAFLLILLFRKQIISNTEMPNQTIVQMYMNYRKDFQDIKELSVESLLILQLKTPIVLVDVRTEQERNVSIIPGAISESEFHQKKDSFKGMLIVAYCTIGYRSGHFAKKIMQEGFLSYNLIGGVLAWAEAKQSFESKQGNTNLVHVYSKEWNLLPQEYQAVW